MKRVTIFFLIHASLFGQSFHEQPEKVSTCQFTLGLETSHSQNIETLLNGKRHSGLGFIIQPRWQYENPEEMHSIYLAMGIAFGSTSVKGDEGSFFPYLKLQYEYEHKVIESEIESWSLGGLAKADYRIARYPTWDESRGYWADFFGVGLISTFEKAIDEKKSWYASVQLPVIGINNRPEAIRNYKMDDPSLAGIVEMGHRDLTFVTIERYFNPTINLGIHFAGDFLGLLYYKFEYLYATTHYSKPYKLIDHGLGIGVNL